MVGNIKSFVVDASFVLSYLIPLEKSEEVDKIFQDQRAKKIQLISHNLLPFEVINGLKYAYIRKRINLKLAKDLLNDFLGLNIFYKEVDFANVFPLAIEKNLTFYDASYFYLALTKKLPLLTFDKQLKKIK